MQPDSRSSILLAFSGVRYQYIMFQYTTVFYMYIVSIIIIDNTTIVWLRIRFYCDMQILLT